MKRHNYDRAFAAVLFIVLVLFLLILLAMYR